MGPSKTRSRALSHIVSSNPILVRPEHPISNITISAYEIPTATPESDGTLEWESTTLVVVHAEAGDASGWGYSYADMATASLARKVLAHEVLGLEAFDIEGAYVAMNRSVRNLGRAGVASMAISAVDTALWDLKARLLNLPLVSLLGAVRKGIPVYGSGGFTSYSDSQMAEQFSHWLHQGITMLKMKIGRDRERDLDRVIYAREEVGIGTQLFVDANGAYSRKEAVHIAQDLAELDVKWFEEPVSSDDLEGLHLLCVRGPAGMDISAGEYGYDLSYFLRMLEGGAVDVLQADATRCGGFTGFLKAAALCEAFHIPMSSHCAPYLHVHPACAAAPMRHSEYFFDHVRIEQLLFDGLPSLHDGSLEPDLSRPGNGMEFKEADAEQYRVL